MPFSHHIEAAKETWIAYMNASFGSDVVSVVVTTESKSVLREQAAFASNPILGNGLFDFQFILNHRDVAQDTGYLEIFDQFTNESEAKSDSIMVSAMASLRLQLMTRVTLGNCCSNFHLLLKDLLFEGCGSCKQNTFQCLQDHGNAKFRVCCTWDKSSECLARRAKEAVQSNPL
jgi:hypothetical protein